MPLTLEIRHQDRIIILKCKGRIAYGPEASSFESCITELLPETSDFVLHLGGVDFVDSGGLGTLVRLLTRIRRDGGDLKLCVLPQAVRHLLHITTLEKLFDIHESETAAIAAFGRSPHPGEKSSASVKCRIICLHSSADTLAYLGELLRRAGYEAVTSRNLPDAMVLLKAAKTHLVVVDPGVGSSRVYPPSPSR